MEKPLNLQVFLSLLTLVFCVTAHAQTSRKKPVGFIQKAVVFPIEAQKPFQKVADDAWWTIREELTDTKRILVAAKRFMVQKDVYQPRKTLEPPDVILLSQLLDSDVLITSQLVGRDLTMIAYDYFDGGILWQQTLSLHPSIPIEQQLKESAKQLIRDFIASLPSQGHVILDPLINTPVYEEGDIHLAKGDAGANSRVTERDTIQWIRIERVGSGPLFGSGGRIEVIGEGQVLKVENGILTSEIKRTKNLQDIQTFTLIRLPKEAEFLTTQYSLKSDKVLKPELRYNPLPPTTEQDDKGKPLFAALAGIASIVALLLLAL